MGENGMRMVNNKCSEVVVLWQQVWKPGQLTEWSIVHPYPTPQEAPIINKQPKLLMKGGFFTPERIHLELALVIFNG